MKVFNCIFGILSIIGAIYCMFYPGLTFLNTGWIVTILLGVWGICSVIDYFAKRKKAKAEQSEAIMGTLGLVVGIAAAVISILAMFMPSIRLMFDVIILCIFSGWLVVDGISSVAMSFKVKEAASSGAWLIPLFCGILVIIGGIYGFFHLVFAAQTIGFIIGVLLAVYGVKLILLAFEKPSE